MAAGHTDTHDRDLPLLPRRDSRASTTIPKEGRTLGQGISNRSTRTLLVLQDRIKLKQDPILDK